MTTKDKIIDPSNFDLDAFVAGCYQATRYVPIVQDQRKVGEILRLREEYYTALEFNDSSDKDSTAPVGLGDDTASDVDRARAAYFVAYKALEDAKVTVEVRAVGSELRNQITEDFLTDRGLTRADLQLFNGEVNPQKEAYLEELDRLVMVHAFVFPALPTVSDVNRFAAAVGDTQWAQIKTAWASSLTQAINLERLSPDFLPRSWSEVDGEGS